MAVGWDMLWVDKSRTNISLAGNVRSYLLLGFIEGILFSFW